jgi:hypothetical protein
LQCDSTISFPISHFSAISTGRDSIIDLIERWMAKGCEKGQSRRLQKLFADGHVVDAEMEQAAGVTVSDVRVAT